MLAQRFLVLCMFLLHAGFLAAFELKPPSSVDVKKW